VVAGGSGSSHSLIGRQSTTDAPSSSTTAASAAIQVQRRRRIQGDCALGAATGRSSTTSILVPPASAS
jgi:hypothetical protein